MPIAGTGDDERITGGATHTKTNTARPVFGAKACSARPFLRERSAVELLVGEEGERSGKVVVRHGNLKAAETQIRAIDHRHRVANYAAAESGMFKCVGSGKGGGLERLSKAEGEHVGQPGCLLTERLNISWSMTLPGTRSF